MQTYSHVILTAVINKRLKLRQKRLETAGEKDRWPPVASKALLIGSFAPDAPLILVTIILIIYDMAGGPPLNPASELARQSNVAYLFDDLFFNSPWVKALHNLFHAPILTLVYTLVGYWAWQRHKKWGAALFWFGIATSLHTWIDIPLHYDDGPLLFFPFEWQTRFYSPVSYWDPSRYGNIWSPIEHLLDLVLLLYLVWGWWQKRRQQRAAVNQ